MDGSAITLAVLGLAVTTALHLFTAARWSGRIDSKQETILEEIHALRVSMHATSGQLARHEGAIQALSQELGRLEVRVTRIEAQP